MKKIYTILCFMMISFGNLIAQDIIPSYSLVLNADYTRFRNNEQSGYLEVYYGFYPQYISLKKNADNYSGVILLQMKIKNTDTGENVIEDHANLPVTVKDTSDAAFKYPLIAQSGYALNYGNYNLKIVAIDSLMPARMDSSSFNFEISPYSEETMLSDLELCSDITTSQKKTSYFYKNSLEVIPNPSLLYGVTSYPVLFTYLEMYNLKEKQKYTLKKTILDGSGNTIKEASKIRQYSIKSAVDVETTNISSIPSGAYQVKIEVYNGDQLLSQAVKKFYIYNAHLTKKVIATTENNLLEAELSKLSGKELDDEFEKAQYLSTKEEIQMYDQLNTVSGKREFLKNFWIAASKGVRYFPPIQRAEYLGRAKVADQRYSTFNKEGWSTDRGRVFILYGEPDNVDRFVQQTDTKPYYIWYYYELEGGVQFVFVDRFGFSRFELVHSTKRGELKDENWRDYIQ